MSLQGDVWNQYFTFGPSHAPKEDLDGIPAIIGGIATTIASLASSAASIEKSKGPQMTKAETAEWIRKHQLDLFRHVNRERRKRGEAPIQIPASIKKRTGPRAPSRAELQRRRQKAMAQPLTIAPVITIPGSGVDPDGSMMAPSASLIAPAPRGMPWYRRPGITGMPIGVEIPIGLALLLFLTKGLK